MESLSPPSSRLYLDGRRPRFPPLSFDPGAARSQPISPSSPSHWAAMVIPLQSARGHSCCMEANAHNRRGGSLSPSTSIPAASSDGSKLPNDGRTRTEWCVGRLCVLVSQCRMQDSPCAFEWRKTSTNPSGLRQQMRRHKKKTRPGFRTLNTGSFHLNDHRLPLLLERQCSAHRHAHVPFSTLPFSMFSPLSLSCSSFVSLIHSLTDIHGSGDLFNHRGVAAAAAAGAATVVPRCHLPPVGRRVTRRERVCMRAYCPLSVQRVDRPGKPSREH